MDKEMIEILYQLGKIPSRFYYQLNGKSAQENYIAQKREEHKKFQEERENYNNIQIKIVSKVKK